MLKKDVVKAYKEMLAKVGTQKAFDTNMAAIVDRMKYHNIPDEEIADAMAQWKGGICPKCQREYIKCHSNVIVKDLSKDPDSFDVIETVLSDFWYYEPPCNCLDQMTQAKKDAEALKKRLEGSGIPKDMHNITFDKWDYAVDNVITDCQKRCKDMLKDGAFFSGLGAVLMGTPGVGKTHIGVSMLRWIVENSKMEVLFIPMADIIGKIIRSGKDGNLDFGEEVRLFDVVMLDDIDKVHSQSEWVKQQIFGIIDGMMREKKHIIITTNILKSLDFDEKFDLSVSSRIMGGCQFVVFPEGHDYRKARKIMELKKKQDLQRSLL
ncbi:ATP-binding protein [Candidatus Pacearchaeota archaeon]|nr:ATP-binding protein [Candidatus Pacearchaeota archaeon]